MQTLSMFNHYFRSFLEKKEWESANVEYQHKLLDWLEYNHLRGSIYGRSIIRASQAVYAGILHQRFPKSRLGKIEIGK